VRIQVQAETSGAGVRLSSAANTVGGLAEAFGRNWKHLEANGSIWKKLEAPGSFWKNPESGRMAIPWPNGHESRIIQWFELNTCAAKRSDENRYSPVSPGRVWSAG
jgi:hypothetical protein